jgi:murein DD-endopeptidase MepM/ murein hydrolase activator NlpD
MASPCPTHKLNTPYRKPGKHWKLGYHTGVDYTCPVGTDICAMADGKVLEVGDNVSFGPSYGLSVIIDHGDGQRAIYAHLSKVLVKKGSKVKIGQHIAESGNTGNSTGPHLHCEIRTKPFLYGNDIDPAVLIKKKAGE